MGMPVGDTSTAAPDRAWQDGVDLPSVLAECDGMGVLGYVREPAELRRDLTAYRQAMDARSELSVAVRPMPPDSLSAKDVADKISVAGEFGAGWVEFYHYGFMRLKNLDWIGEALQSGSGAVRG